MHGNELRPYYLCYARDIAAVGTSFNAFGNDAVLRPDTHLSPSRQRADVLCVTPQINNHLSWYRLGHLVSVHLNLSTLQKLHLRYLK